MEKKSNVQKEKIQNDVRKRQFEGTVLSVSGNKTIKVEVQSIRIHPKYNKQYKQSRSFAVHDEKNVAKVGDRVTFEECRPLSSTKRWFLVTK
jgi:small subunit ribosomal protein S17